MNLKGNDTVLVQKLIDRDGMTHWLFLNKDGDPLVILSQYEAVSFAEAVLDEQEDIEKGEDEEDG